MLAIEGVRDMKSCFLQCCFYYYYFYYYDVYYYYYYYFVMVAFSTYCVISWDGVQRSSRMYGQTVQSRCQQI